MLKKNIKELIYYLIMQEYLKASSIDKISYKDWKKVMDTNINGMFLCAKYLML